MKDMGKIKPNTESTGRQADTGYPQTGINEGVTHMKMRGAGAATKGTMFVSEREERKPRFGRTGGVPVVRIQK